MVIVYKVDAYRRQMMVKIKAIKQAKTDSTKQLANIHKLESQIKAPFQSGVLRRNIIVQKIKNGHRVMSFVNDKFPYHLFVNRTGNYRTLSFKERGGSVYYGPNQIVEYGGAALSRNNKQIVWSGYPQYFDLGRAKALLRAKDVYVSAVRTALK